MEAKKEFVLPSVREKQIGQAYRLRNDSEEELLREMLTPTSEWGSSKEREEVEFREK